MNDGLSIFKQERPEKTDKHENLYSNAVWSKREKKKIVKSAKRQKKCDENLMKICSDRQSCLTWTFIQALSLSSNDLSEDTKLVQVVGWKKEKNSVV